ncbi:MAG TPA: M1 family metallopeptidase, partial [Longimicrobium sp.]
PLVADSIVQDGRRLTFRRDGNAFFVALPTEQRRGTSRSLRFYYHGRPRVAQHAPWDGGFVWGADSTGATWVATAVQGLGASAWWPNKDTQADEPDSQRVAITVPRGMTDVSNGRLRATRQNADGTTTYEWFVANPINNYDVAVNAGSYAHFTESYAGEGGNLTLDYWPLAYHLEAARRQFAQVKPMLQCFERWFGPYPWYADGYKLVETPHLGMEHQSAVAYGNRYLNGYLGRDLSRTGLGMRWDFIIIHESAHEWWGNSITSTDLADMWVHESFANYAEGLYTECQQGKEAGARYVIGTRAAIENDAPIIPPFGVNAEGSGDMYYKGGNMLHTIRQIVGDDEKWRGILRGLQSTFRHQAVTGMQVRGYISRQAGVDLSKVFQQYLETTRVPVLEYQVVAGSLRYRWTNVVPGFDMPVKVRITPDGWTTLRPTEQWQTARMDLRSPTDFAVDPNFYVESRAATRR